MSLSARNWAWETDNRPRIATDAPAGPEDVPWVPLSPAEKLVLLCLAELESAAEGYAYPSYATIARRTCLNVRTVQRVVKVLGESGLVHVARDRRVDGRWLSCIYRFPAVPEEYREKDQAWMHRQRFTAANGTIHSVGAPSDGKPLSGRVRTGNR